MSGKRNTRRVLDRVRVMTALLDEPTTIYSVHSGHGGRIPEMIKRCISGRKKKVSVSEYSDNAVLLAKEMDFLRC